jgi:hypothetical protein
MQLTNGIKTNIKLKQMIVTRNFLLIKESFNWRNDEK